MHLYVYHRCSPTTAFFQLPRARMLVPSQLLVPLLLLLITLNPVSAAHGYGTIHHGMSNLPIAMSQKIVMHPPSMAINNP